MVIHLPSLGLSEGQRQGLSKPQVRENSQMARLCDLADPLVEVLYVAPFALPEVSYSSGRFLYNCTLLCCCRCSVQFCAFLLDNNRVTPVL